ncbi:hypothetical protein VNI00_013627 [Paramarasmius palmivorus]|uniref:Uncharacterized protein n=1 Tax=Paramarasmius palmivorus TaxID=297713 RepID=A0AAW0BWL1_9AGAR
MATTSSPTQQYLPPKSCDNPVCSGSCGTPRAGSIQFGIGDIVSVCISVYTPFKTLLDIPVSDTESFYTASGRKGARPCIITHISKSGNVYSIVIMASFSRSEQDNVPPAFKDFLIPIPTARRHVQGGVEHIHTTPEWESAPQYLVPIQVQCQKRHLQKRWQSHEVDSTSQRQFDFYLEELARATLNGIIRKRLLHWNAKGKNELTREEYLERLEKVKEAYAESLKTSTNVSHNSGTPGRVSGCKRTVHSKMTSLAEVPEEPETDSEGFKLVCSSKRRKHHTENYQPTPSIRSRR